MKVAVVVFLALMIAPISGLAKESVCARSDSATEEEMLKEIERLRNDSSMSAQLFLANCYLKVDMFDEALSIYDLLEKKYGANAELNKEIGMAYYWKQDYERALEKLIESVRSEYKDPQAILYVGFSFYKKGEVQNGIEALKMGIESLGVGPAGLGRGGYSPISEDLHFYLSQMYLDHGKEKLAAEVLKAGLEQYSGSRRLFDEIMKLGMRESVGLSSDEVKRYCSEVLIRSSKYCSSSVEVHK